LIFPLARKRPVFAGQKGRTNVSRIILFLVVSFLIVFALNPATTRAQYEIVQNYDTHYAPLPDSTRLLIEQAIPAQASAKTVKPRKILVCTLNKRDGKMIKGHGSIPYANYALKLMGEKTGAFEVVFSNDTLMFKPENLQQFDAICFNNTNGVLFTDPELRASLLDYVYSGKGFIGLHAAGATFVQWPVYDQFPAFGVMLGGYENGGHPWKEWEWINLKVNEPSHPLNAAFKTVNFDISDEVFQFQAEPYSRDKLRVLLSIDTDKTDMSERRRILPERLADRDLAISWVHNYGRGRVFYSTLGHNAHINWNAPVLQHFLDGIQYALGDLCVSDIPSNKITPATLVMEKRQWQFGLAPQPAMTLYELAGRTAAAGLMTMNASDTQLISADLPKKLTPALTGAEILQIRAKLLDDGVRIATLDIQNIPADEQQARQLCVFAQKMGVETLVVAPDAAALNLLKKYCSTYALRVAVTNKTAGKTLKSKELHKLLNNDKNLGVCLDMESPALTKDRKNTLKTLGERIFILRFQDKNIKELSALLQEPVIREIKPLAIELQCSEQNTASVAVVNQTVLQAAEQK